MRFLGVLATVTCLVLCVKHSLEDVRRYWQFPTSVVYNADTHVVFPALTLCFQQGYNQTKLMAENDVDAEALTGDNLLEFNTDLLKHLINYSFPAEELILSCRMRTTSDLCQEFSCRHLWKALYTYMLHSVCYVMDMDRVAESGDENGTYHKCAEPWKYKLELRALTGHYRTSDQSVMALVHESNSFSGGLTRTLMMTAHHSYILSATQTDVLTLPLPYETACTDYRQNANRRSIIKAKKTQEQECEETCIQDMWKNLCGCVSASYMLRHCVDVPVCSTVERFKCRADVAKPEKLQGCRISCSRPCESSEYQARIFGSLQKTPEPYQFQLSLLLGSYRRNIVNSSPMLKGDTLFSYLEGHIGMWLGLTFLSLVQLAARLYAFVSDYARRKPTEYRRLPVSPVRNQKNVKSQRQITSAIFTGHQADVFWK